MIHSSLLLVILGGSDSLEDFRTVWRISGHCERFLDSLENLLGSLENIWKVWKISGKPERYMDSLENSQTV